MTPMERWLSKIDKGAANGCWEWTGARDKKGYGQFDVTIDGKRKNHRAHRWGYVQLVRDLLDAETIDHLCRNRACVNPEHLEPVPHAVNVARGEAGKHNSVKTHCAKGHEFTEENTSGRGKWRVCRTCRNESSRESQRKKRGFQGGITSPDKTHCVNGHEFTEENSYYPPRGGRACRECTRVKVRDYMRRKRAEAKASQ